MERIYTPWRGKYIMTEAKNKQESDCIFCKILGQDSAFDPENLVLIRNQNTFLILNRYPYNSGHLMVLPNSHIGDLCELTSEVQAEMMHLTSFGVDLLKKVYRPAAFNVGINMGEVAGGSISKHLHIHIVPRWQGDTNFMPVIGETKMLPEELMVTYQRLHKAIQ